MIRSSCFSARSLVISSVVGSALLCSAHLAMAQDLMSGVYIDLKVGKSSQGIGSDQKVSPRQTDLISGSGNDRFTMGSISVGKRLTENGRAEIEFTFPKSTEYTTYWAPFNANANVFQVKAQRLMFNAYQDYPLADSLSGNLMLGLGWAGIKAKGWQGNPNRFLYEKTNNKLALSIGGGVDYALAPEWKLGVGYRYVYMGKIESGVNDYNPAASPGAKDEMMRGKLAEHNLFVSVRKEF